MVHTTHNQLIGSFSHKGYFLASIDLAVFIELKWNKLEHAENTFIASSVKIGQKHTHLAVGNVTGLITSYWVTGACPRRCTLHVVAKHLMFDPEVEQQCMLSSM